MASSLSPHTQRITSITLSQEELAAKQLTSHHLQEALEALYRDGILVLNNAIPTSDVDALNARMAPEAEKLYASSSVHQISLFSLSLHLLPESVSPIKTLPPLQMTPGRVYPANSLGRPTTALAPELATSSKTSPFPLSDLSLHNRQPTRHNYNIPHAGSLPSPPLPQRQHSFQNLSLATAPPTSACRCTFQASS
jgi:hypothetical protein